jgi:hypothetical protein
LFTLFNISYKERALEIDASISSQPIISDKKSLDEMHYHLSYGKAASLLRAIVDSMDPVVFQRAVRVFYCYVLFYGALSKLCLATSVRGPRVYLRILISRFLITLS